MTNPRRKKEPTPGKNKSIPKSEKGAKSGVYFDHQTGAPTPFAGQNRVSDAKQLFPSLTEQNKQKIKGKLLKIMQNT